MNLQLPARLTTAMREDIDARRGWPRGRPASHRRLKARVGRIAWRRADRMLLAEGLAEALW